MKGRTRTDEEVRLHDRIAALGCICCRIEGNYNPWVSIHHVNGRTKPFCHFDVLPLCGPHHTKLDPTVLAVHGDKRRWEAAYGNQYDLIKQIMAELNYPYINPEDREHLIARPATRAKKKPAKVCATDDRKVTQGRPLPPAPRKTKVPTLKRQETAEQAKYLADQKELQKELQRQRKAQYELENKDKIEAQKTSAREWAKAQRRRIAAESKAKSPKATRKRKVA